MTEILPQSLQRILRETPTLQDACLVGGCVRDWLLGEPVVDFDVEVYGVGYPELARSLERWGQVNFVGRAFGILKLRLSSGETFDFSLPRRDSKTGPGHQGFEVQCDPGLDPATASARRDFSINALLWDPRRREVLDFHGGLADLQARRLRHASPAFAEDPLRVLRGMQFAARFRLEAAPETLALCRSIVATHAELPVERVREEWWKWAVKARLPSAGLHFLDQAGWRVHYPELDRLPSVPQDAEWHPEGDVWTHTLHCLDALVALTGWRDAPAATRGVLTFAVLLHDVGKADATVRQLHHGRMRWLSPGHEARGLPLAQSFLDRIGMPNTPRERILPLVAQHMAHLVDPTPRAVRRLASRLHPATIRELALVMEADASGRPPLPPGPPANAVGLLRRATELEVLAARPRPILQGRHLLLRGLSPGPAMGALLDQAFEAQLDGEFHNLDTALSWLDRHAPVHPSPPESPPDRPPARV